MLKERKAKIKEIIDAIPTNKTDLLAYEVLWNQLDDTLISERIKPWIEKKVSEYIGDDEPSLVTFICERLTENSDPNRLLADLAMVRRVVASS